MKVTLGERTAETAAVYFERAQSPAIRETLPQKAQTLEEALADFRKTQEPGANSFGRIICADGRYVGDVWCYCMDPDGDPQAMVSYCVFARELWGGEWPPRRWSCFWRRSGSGSAWNASGRSPLPPIPVPSGCWRKMGSGSVSPLWRMGWSPGTICGRRTDTLS